jgi:hypothetical protein
VLFVKSRLMPAPGVTLSRIKLTTHTLHHNKTIAHNSITFSHAYKYTFFCDVARRMVADLENGSQSCFYLQ